MTPLEIAQSYIGKGWNPIPVGYKSKKPTAGDGWQLLRVTADNAAQYFNGAQQNVGIQMGPASNGLADGDMDTAEARIIAPYFMPDTNSKFGRESARRSHYLYYSNVADIPEIGAAAQFRDPTDQGMICELRVGGGDKGAQTVGPGSIHDTGEEVIWIEDGDPARVPGAELLQCIRKVAALALLSAHWPEAGKKARHNQALRLGGFLARCGWNKDQIGLALKAIALAVKDDPEVADRKKAAEFAYDGFEGGQHTFGYPALKEDFGEAIAAKVAGWLGFDFDIGDNQKTDDRDAQSDPATHTLESATASSYQMAAVQWVWPNRFAVGKLGIIAGLPDEGKGQVLCYLAARITSNVDKLWPCKEGEAPDGNVLLLTAEDDPADTVVPRLASAGADLDRIHIVKMVRDHKGGRRMFSLVTDLELLRSKVVAIGAVVAVMIDPISAYFGHGKMDSFRTTDVRAVLGPLCELAAELKIAIIAIMHFNKKMDVTNALLRISDSLAFGAAARHVYGVIADAENKRKLFVRAKNNLSSAANDQALAFHFSAKDVGTDPQTGEAIWAPHIIFEPKHVEVTATEAMQAAAENRSPGAADKAKNFLADMLDNGPVAKDQIEEAAEAQMIAERTLRRAHDMLKLQSGKERGKANGSWFWRLPDRGHRWPWEIEGGHRR